MSDISWINTIINTETEEDVHIFDFRLRKEWIGHVIDELEENLQLFFCLVNSVQNLPYSRAREQARMELHQLSTLAPLDLIDHLKHLHTKFGDCRYEISDRYQHILKAVQNLHEILPIEGELLLPYKRKSTQDEKLQWITNILVGKTKIHGLRHKIQATHNAIEETKFETSTLIDRSSDEIHEIIDESQQVLIELKQAGDLKFAELQDETSKKILDLDNVKEYRDLVQEHEQKRRKITKLTVQLQLWIKQYDKFVGEPMKELQELEAEVDKFEEWKEAVYDPQLERYEELRASVDMFEAELTEEQVEAFRIAHAARIIQRGWRRVLEKRKMKKKKGKKGKKKGGVGKTAKNKKK
ncbi:dynein regulatory complex protein 10-like [Aedes albopictus]|uniref:Dynein regulatory complex protein 10 n=1 Tax=Aedes albopictus TaxID=7160 RepID=A0ABM1YWR2_AEDAL